MDTSWISGRKTVAISFDDGPVSNDNANRIHNALTQSGFHATFFYWGNKINSSNESADWNGATVDQMVSKIRTAANNGSLNGQVVLMHETNSNTVQAVEQLCPWLQNNGYAIMTVSEMCKYNNKEMFSGNVYNNGW